MSETSAKVGRWNRQILAVFWGLFGVICLVIPLVRGVSATGVLPFPLVVGACFLASSVGFFLGKKWGRVAIGVVVAPLSLLCFDRLLTMHFQRYYGPLFVASCLLLLAGFYTWVFIFTGLDRNVSHGHQRHHHHHRRHKPEDGGEHLDDNDDDLE